MPYALQVNGVRRSLDVDGDTPLLWVIRDILGLTGTRAYQCADRAALTLRPHMRSRYLRFT
jgi:isoquinoline 1-oxidoreductase subunit alpha